MTNISDAVPPYSDRIYRRLQLKLSSAPYIEERPKRSTMHYRVRAYTSPESARMIVTAYLKDAPEGVRNTFLNASGQLDVKVVMNYFKETGLIHLMR